MNFYKIFLTILITSLLWACDNSDPIIPNPPEVDIFEMKWANYIFQGEFFHEYDEETFQELKDVSQTLIIDNDIELKCSQCQESQN